MEGITKFTRHFIHEMDETGLQKCIFCGEIIADGKENSQIKQFLPGNIYICYHASGAPFILSTDLPPMAYYVYCCTKHPGAG